MGLLKNNITLFEACEILNRSKKSISRYIRRGLLHPQEVKSKQGTPEYRFSKADIEDFKAQRALKAKQGRQDTQDTADRTRETYQPGQDSEVITLLKDTTRLLRDQLKTKDGQIKDLGGKIDQLIERDRETNILIGQLQSKVLMLEKPKEHIDGDAEETGQTRQDKGDKPEPDKPEPAKVGFCGRLWKALNTKI